MGVMLDQWAEKHAEIARVEELLEKLAVDRHIEWISMRRPHDVVCEFYEIDQAQLEKERRELLDMQRKLFNEKDVRTWKCPECETTVQVSQDWLADHGDPVCSTCDCDMELQPVEGNDPRDRSGQ